MLTKQSVIEVSVPYTLVSPNKKTHWGAAHKKNKALDEGLRYFLNTKAQDMPALPIKVTLTRVAPRFFDDDNLVAAMKGARDSVASFIFPGLAAGRADGDKRLSWEYIQEKGKEHLLVVKIQHNDRA